MKKNKNILIFCTSMQKGGAERVISLLLKEFENEKDIKVHFMMMEEGIDYNLPKSIIPIILSNSKKSGVKKLLELPFIAMKLKKYIKENNINIVMSFLYRPNYINILAKIFGSNHKSIINIRSTTSRYKNEGLLGKINLFLINNLFDRADLIISNSKGVDEDLKSIINITTNTKVIYNPIDIEYINSKRDICEDVNFQFKEDKKYVISVGRLIPLKRNIDLIKAFFELQKNDNSLELLFLGDGILKDNLISESIKLSIKEKVHFLGNVKNPFYYLNKSDLFVLNSEIEGFPNVLVEAMTCELPVISSDCKSGPREILEDEKYGLLYPVGDVGTLIEKIKFYLYQDVDKEVIKVKSLKRIEDFSVDKIMNQFKKVLEVE
ncbi:glycosyltransferase [Aliarcobacter butzleri]|uniref:glycosyltransferase n=1 Tax=Aliarcobacter butzleri TaxID=28197 RepID=UPI001EDB874A|nr:glycosyltransferase [Aliarcobacter butzleri]MCG3656763.1 glycosyltransferase [Aliarcobacter butzleri]MDK2051432.1 glycosyltransferase [Aliarcobacter butzleri]